MAERIIVAISSPLEAEHVARINDVDPERVEVRYRPDIMPPTRYIADHNGPADWRRSPEQESAFREMLRDADVTWDFATSDGAGPLDLSPHLKWVQTTSAGVGQYVKKLGLQDTDLLVTTASGVHSAALSEFVFASLLFHAKRFPMIQTWQRERHWERYCGGELDGKTLAIIGPGRIGRRVASLAQAFGMTTWALARDERPERASDLGVDRCFRRSELHQMLSGADALVLCMPHTPETEGMLGAAEIAAMKPGVVLVNIARGVVIDEDTMIAALKSGHIAFAGLDVFRTEPLPADSPLWSMDNVIVNPHSASTAESENRKITDLFVHNLRCYLDGRISEMTPLLDKQRMY